MALRTGRDEIVDGDGAFAEKLFHHFVVAFGDHFNKFLVSFLSVISESAGISSVEGFPSPPGV